MVLDWCGVCKLIHRWMKGLKLEQDPYMLQANYIQLDPYYNLIGFSHVIPEIKTSSKSLFHFIF